MTTSPKHAEPAPRNGTRTTTALVALVAALLGGTGGIVITPRAGGDNGVSEALAQISMRLERIETAITELRAEAAVSRYDRENRRTK